MAGASPFHGALSDASDDGLLPPTLRTRVGNIQTSPLLDARSNPFKAARQTFVSPLANRVAHHRERAKPLLSSHISGGHRYYTRRAVSILGSVSNDGVAGSGECTQTTNAACGCAAPDIPVPGEPAGSPADWGLPEEYLSVAPEEDFLEAFQAADGRCVRRVLRQVSIVNEARNVTVAPRWC